MSEWNDTVAVVTGGASGIGAACVELLRSRGATVEIWDRDAVEETKVDVADMESVVTAAKGLEARYGQIKALINCAGVLPPNTPADQAPSSHFVDAFNVNALGSANTSRALFNLLRGSAGKGAIVNVASQAALVSLPNQAAYSMSKGAVAALTRALAIDWGSHGIRVNAVCPGFTLTPMAKIQMTPELDAALARRVPLGHVFEPVEIANVIAFLASQEASAVTGVVMPVDGGWTAGEPALPL